MIETVYPGDKPMWDHITATLLPETIDDIPYGAIMPHHTITAREVAGFYNALAHKISPKTIFLLCPNHYEDHMDPFITADNIQFNTVYGEVRINGQLTKMLENESLAVIHNQAFIKEHGVFFHAPFIKRFFPQATIVPILFTWDAPKESVRKITAFIARHSTPDTFVIASVDFSHFQPRTMADLHDETSFTAIKSFNDETIYDLEIDSPPSVLTLLYAMNALGAQKTIRFTHTNSDEYMKIPEQNTTSHQYFAFVKGPAEYTRTTTVLITGNITVPNDRLFTRTSWKWDRSYDPSKDTSIEQHLKNIRGREDRFLTGFNLYLFDIKNSNTPEIITVGNESISVIRFVENQTSVQENLTQIQRLKKGSSRLIVFYTYTTDTDLNRYSPLFHAFIDAGADAVIGKGNSEIKKEEYRGCPIVYSLGDFITDNTNSNGELLGLIFKDNKILTTFFPLTIINGYPELRYE